MHQNANSIYLVFFYYSGIAAFTSSAALASLRQGYGRQELEVH